MKKILVILSVIATLSFNLNVNSVNAQESIVLDNASMRSEILHMLSIYHPDMILPLVSILSSIYYMGPGMIKQDGCNLEKFKLLQIKL